MSVYGTSADTILQCYCLDEELHKELKESAKYVPGTLRQFLDENTQIKSRDSSSL